MGWEGWEGEGGGWRIGGTRWAEPHTSPAHICDISGHCQSFSTRARLPTRSHSSPDQAVQNMLRSLIRPPRSPHYHPCQPPTNGGRPKGLRPICPSGLPPLGDSPFSCQLDPLCRGDAFTIGFSESSKLEKGLSKKPRTMAPFTL
jgi:hypothetical protein